MARRPRAARLEARTARLKLPVRRKPHDFTTISPGIALGYRRCASAGRWVVKVADGHGGHWTKALGLADDFEDADGEHVLTWWQAQDKARALARGKDSDSVRPGTVAEALADYEKDLIARSASPANARRVRALLSPTMLAKPVALLTARELKHMRDTLVAKGGKPASINRDLKGLKAALNLYAAHDPRVLNRDAWRIGLKALPDSFRSRNAQAVLTDEETRALIAAAYVENDALGLLTEVAAVTGARISQLAGLQVADLQADRAGPRLMMPSSRKGRGIKKITRKPVPITASLATKLKRTASDRTKPLLLRGDGKPWCPANADYRRPFQQAVIRAGLDPQQVTFYALRHTSITRLLLNGAPIRLVADMHDTSVAMIEATYSAAISEHSDVVLRRGLLDIAQPAAVNVVPLAKGR